MNRRAMTDNPTFGQNDQNVFGSQTNIAGDATFYPPAPPIPPPHQIPAPPQDFIGRDDELAKLLAHFDRGATITGLRGLGGVGKTALAYVVAERLRGRFPDGQIMVDLQGMAENPLSPSDAMGQAIHAFHPTARLPDSDAEVAGLYRSILDGKKTLLLLDNALDDRQVRPLLPPPSCGVLITSRRRFTLSGLEPLDLDVLKPDEAVALLSRVLDPLAAAPASGDGPLADIARLCGYLPLALRAAGSMLANTPDLSPSEYADELKAERSRLERLGEEGVDIGVEASFNLSYRRLEPQTASVFRLLSIFPADFDAAAEEAICRDDGNRELRELLRWSLVDYAEGRYRLHDLARIFAAARLEEDGDAGAAAGKRHAEHYREVLAAAKALYKQGGENILAGLGLFDREWANIAAGQAWACRFFAEDPTAAALSSAYPDAGVYVLDLRLHPREMIRWLETALAGARQRKDQAAEGVHLGNLGLAYADLGEPRRAIELYEQYLAIAREIGDRRGEGAGLGNMGLAYADLGETRRAIELYEQALAIAREIGDRRGEGNALGNMGLAYAALGDPRRAIELYEQALAIDREIGNRMGEGAGLGNMGAAYAALGETRRAIEHYEQYLAIAREIGDRRGEGNALGNMGLAYADLGETRRAIEHHEQYLAIAREIGDRRGEGNALGNMGAAYAALGETRRAIEHYEQALAIAREIGDRRGEGAALGNMGLAYAALGKTRRAIEHYDQHLAIAREIGDRRGEGNALFNKSLAFAALGNRPRAVECAEAALAIYEAIESPQAERARQQLAELRAKEP